MKNWLLIILIGSILSGCNDAAIVATNDSLVGNWMCKISFYSNLDNGVLRPDYIYVADDGMNILVKKEHDFFYLKINENDWSNGGLLDYWNLSDNRTNTTNSSVFPFKTITQLSTDKFIYTEEKINIASVKTKIETSCDRIK